MYLNDVFDSWASWQCKLKIDLSMLLIIQNSYIKCLVSGRNLRLCRYSFCILMACHLKRFYKLISIKKIWKIF